MCLKFIGFTKMQLSGHNGNISFCLKKKLIRNSKNVHLLNKRDLCITTAWQNGPGWQERIFVKFVMENMTVIQGKMTILLLTAKWHGAFIPFYRDFVKMICGLFKRPFIVPIMRRVVACALILPLVYNNTKEVH